MSPDLHNLIDAVALVYHEARNVRHLIRGRRIEPQEWKYLTALPTNRDAAWADLQDLRQRAKEMSTPQESLEAFEKRFHVSLARLEWLYAHPSWRNSSYGGNAWHGVTQLVQVFAECLDSGLDEQVATVRERLRAAQHNTGSVQDKLAKLDRSLTSQRSD